MLRAAQAWGLPVKISSPPTRIRPISVPSAPSKIVTIGDKPPAAGPKPAPAIGGLEPGANTGGCVDGPPNPEGGGIVPPACTGGLEPGANTGGCGGGPANPEGGGIVPPAGSGGLEPGANTGGWVG